MAPVLRRLLCSLACAQFLAGAAGADDAPRYAGRPVVEVLEELADGGIDFVYSSELLPPDLMVEAEPQAREPLLVAREILAAHGLRLSAVQPRLFAVVAAPGAAAVEQPPLPAPVRAELAEIVVTTSRYSFDHRGAAAVLRIGGELLAAQPVIGEDAIRAVGRLPGIAQGGLTAQSSIRGGETGEVLTLLDGFPLRQAFHLPGYQSVFGVLDPGLIADADVYTGGFPARYGNRMAGVIDLRTIDAADEPRTALGLSVFNAMARSSGTPGEHVDWLGALRVGTLKPFIHAFAQAAGEPSYADTYARAGFGDPDGLRVTANLLWVRDEFTIARERRGERGRIDSRSRYLWLRADRDWGADLHGSLWLGQSRVEASRAGTVDDPAYATGFVNDRRSSTYRELRGHVEWDLAPDHWLEAGFEWTEEDADYFYAAEAAYDPAVAQLFGRPAALSRTAVLSPGRERLAYFATHRWQLGRDLVSEVGLRAQRTLTAGATTEDWSTDPRVNLRWQVSPQTSLRAHWGRFHQTDEVHELKIEDGLTAFPEAQMSEHAIVGLDHRFGGGLAARLEWFRKLQTMPRPHFENLLDPLSVVPEIAADRFMVLPDSAEVRGAELSLVAQTPELYWWASVAWSQATDTVGGRKVPRSWDQTWAVTAGFDWSRGSWRYGAIASAHRGWPTTQVLGTSLGERNRSRFPTRIGLDLRAEHRRPLAVGELVLTFEVANAVNLGNDCCQELVPQAGPGGTTFRTVNSNWLPVVPSIGVLWEF